MLYGSVSSALAALPTRGEVIVVDDHSVTPAAKILEGFETDLEQGRLRIVLNHMGNGPAAARNHGVSEALGQIVLFLDDDDLMHPSYPGFVLEMQALGYAYGFAAIKRFQDGTQPVAQLTGDVTEVPLADLSFKKQIGGLGCGFWVKREVFNSIGGINPALRVNEDTDLSLRLLKSGAQGVFSPRLAIYVRDHASPAAHLTNSTPAALRAKYFKILLHEHRAWLGTHREAREFLMRRYVKMLTKTLNLRELVGGLRWLGADLSLWIYGFANYLMYRIKGKDNFH